ncbi:hypothetical protein J2S74_000659 [Evansella vedderi]|uniref:Uncharacterized protein n=1 Tax=Evansella vedderi TaxID=38282 RepID=A0ABT9ZRC2_9BACI|nr:hypothetical protein [Evansella vedderi]MDQ0253287.1 hypothetical protein [Evansella vedderi]
MDEEEARLMLLALEQTMEVYKEITAGLKIPDLLADEKVYAKMTIEEMENRLPF